MIKIKYYKPNPLSANHVKMKKKIFCSYKPVKCWSKNRDRNVASRVLLYPLPISLLYSLQKALRLVLMIMYTK